MIVFIKILFSHILCNFLVQRNSWIADKERKKHKSYYLYLQIILFGIVSCIIVNEGAFIKFAIILAITFGVIEFIILNFQKPETKSKYFLISQTFFIITVALITAIYKNYSIDINFFNLRFWTILSSILFLSKPSSKIISNILNIWFCDDAKYKNNSLSRAGHYIGILERLFIFLFILTNHFEAIGFLLATKSIFRFGEFKDEIYRELTEYYFVGTLLSFGIALLTGLLVQFGLLHFG